MGVCGTNHDCRQLYIENGTCLDMGNTNICVNVDECQEQCSNLQKCSQSETKCIFTGKDSCIHVLMSFISDLCISNRDCSNVPLKPHCQQYAKGSRKTCQSRSPCQDTCSPEQFCSLDAVCQGGDPEDGKETLTVGGPDINAFCVFPFIWKSHTYRACKLVGTSRKLRFNSRKVNM
jgi:hypothetical protein